MLRCCNTNDGSPWFSSRCNKSASLRLQSEVLCGGEWQNSIHHALPNNKLICNPAKNKNHESNLQRGLRQQLSSKILTKSKRPKKLQKIVLTLYRTETGSDSELYSEKNSSMRFSFCFKPPLTHGWERILLLTVYPWFPSRWLSLSFVNWMFKSSSSSRWSDFKYANDDTISHDDKDSYWWVLFPISIDQDSSRYDYILCLDRDVSSSYWQMSLNQEFIEEFLDNDYQNGYSSVDCDYEAQSSSWS
jgi:hypothetical protein